MGAANSRSTRVIATDGQKDFAALDRLPKKLRLAIVEADFDFSAEQMEQMLYTACGGDVENAVWQIHMNNQAMLIPFRQFLLNPRKIEFDDDGLPLYS